MFHLSALWSRSPEPVGALLFIALAFGGPGYSHAASTDIALSLKAAQHFAERNAPLVDAADAQARAARELGKSVGQLPDPVLRAGIENLPVNGPDRFSLTRDFMTMRSIGVMQEFPRAEKRAAKVERQERDAELALAQGQLAAALARRDVGIAWVERFYAEAVRALWTEQLDETGRQIDAADTNYRVSRGGQVEVFAARSQRELVRDRLSQIDRQIQSATARLQRWIPDANARSLGPRPDLDKAPIAAEHVAAVLAHHPQITVWDRQIALAEAEAHIARANRALDWSAEVAYSQRGPSYSNMVSISVSIPIQWDRPRRQDREIASKLALVDQARGQREEALRAHIAEVTILLQDWQNLRERLARYEKVLLPLAAERKRAALTAYGGGTATVAPVLEARRNEIEVRIEMLRLEMEAAQRWIDLTYFTSESSPREYRP